MDCFYGGQRIYGTSDTVLGGWVGLYLTDPLSLAGSLHLKKMRHTTPWLYNFRPLQIQLRRYSACQG